MGAEDGVEELFRDVSAFTSGKFLKLLNIGSESTAVALVIFVSRRPLHHLTFEHLKAGPGFDHQTKVAVLV
ncbi:MAG: hypothetical protein WBW53_11550 [Terriglobales bacterium]